MKKKIFAVVMCAVLCLCLALPTFAAGTVEADYNGEQTSQDVKITIDGQVVHVYLVDIEFTNPTFTYSTGMQWNPDEYIYENITEPSWAGEGKVTITNHSDLKVDFAVTSENVETSFGALAIDVTGGTGSIAKCNVGDVKGSHNATATFKVSGTPTVTEISAQKLGEILVKISK